MGHKVGWIPLYAGVAGGADVILIPEIPYDMDNVIKTIEHRMETGSRFTIVAVAEGAISKEDAALPKKEYQEEARRAYEPVNRVRHRQGDRGQDRFARPASPSPATRSAAASPTPRTAFLRPSAASRQRSVAYAASLAT